MFLNINKKYLLCLTLITILSIGKLNSKLSEYSATNDENSIELVEDQNISKKTANYFLCLKAGYDEARGKVKEALVTNEKLLNQTKNPYASEGSIRLLYEIGQLEKIASMYEKKEKELNTAFKDNLEMQLIFAQSLLACDKDSKAEALFLNLSKTYPNNDQVAYYTAVTYMKQNQTKKALSYTQKCIENKNLKGRHFLFHFLKSKIFLQNNQLKEALAEINKSLELFPVFDKALLLKAILQQQRGQIDEAIKEYKHFLNLVGTDEFVEKQLIQLLFTEKRYDEAFEYLQKAKQDSAEYYFDMALVAFKNNKNSIALENIEKVFSKDANYQKAMILKVEIFLALKKPKEALKFLQSWLTKNPEDASGVHTLLLLEQTGISLKDLTQTLEAISQKHPQATYISSSLADLYIEQKLLGKGLGVLEKLLKAAQDTDVKNKITYQIAYIYFVTDKYNQLEKTLKHIIKEERSYAPSCNLLAYFYAIKNKNLSTAESLAQKALSDDPTSPHYLDTMGLIKYKQGHKKEAIKLFEQALSVSPGEKEIMEHLKQAQE